MAAITSFPQEILLDIFTHIGTAAQLAICRLVCRQWNTSAEEAMLGCKIVLDSLDKAIQLYGHLCTDITKGRYIKHLHFEIQSVDLPIIYTHLLPLAFTPSIELLTGTVRPSSFFTTLIQIADKSSTEFSNLGELPDSLGDDDNMHLIKAAIKFNFKSLFFTIGTHQTGLNWNIINLLEEFKDLQTLKLTGGIHTWKSLEKALKHCKNLDKLVLKDMPITGSFSSKEEVRSWVTNHVQQCPPLSVIEFDKVALRPDLLEYLMYRSSGEATVLHSTGHFLYTTPAALERIFDVLETIGYWNLAFILPSYITVREAVALVGRHQRQYGMDLSIERYNNGQDELVMNYRKRNNHDCSR
ncbi:hypothetical protein MBANPS3_003083 [Mucor bainieri]